MHMIEQARNLLSPRSAVRKRMHMGLFYRLISFFIVLLVFGILIIVLLAPCSLFHWDQQAQIGLFQFWAEVVGFAFAGSSLYLVLRRATLSLILDTETKGIWVDVLADGNPHDVSIYVWNPSEIGVSHIVVDLLIEDEKRNWLGLQLYRIEDDLTAINPSGLGTWSIAPQRGAASWIWQSGEAIIPSHNPLHIMNLPVKLERRTHPRPLVREIFMLTYSIWGENTDYHFGYLSIGVMPMPEPSSPVK